MPATPLEEIEQSLHHQFGEKPPTEKEAADFLVKTFPRMDFGITIAIALAALALQGWQVYRSESDRHARTKASGGDKTCMECGEPEISKNEAGKSVCVNGHTW